MASPLGLPTLSLGAATVQDLRTVIRTYPLIDNHAHNILLPEHAYGSPDLPFETSISEAQGSALSDHIQSSLCFFRAQKQLAEFFGCAESWRDIKNARNEWIRRDYQGFVQASLSGIHTLLLDDGLNTELLYPFQWHTQVVPECSRIVRIEAVAAEVIRKLVPQAGLLKVGSDLSWDKSQSEAFLIRFNVQFRNQIRAFTNDRNVRGFKSVICYRTGLDVGLESRRILRPQHSLEDSELLKSFHEYLQKAVRSDSYRIETKPFNDYLVVAVCDVIDKRIEAEGEGLPIQFHCGFGDSDINLEKANPAYLQPLLEEFPNVDIVMLHGAYPYTREAGYLASVYSNAWLDIGGMFVTVSRDAQENMLRQALELAPTTKILLSTDAHFFPETYYLGLKQLRDSLERVILAYLEAGDFTVSQAVTVVTDMLFWNSNNLYRLDQDQKYPDLLSACGRSSTGSITAVSSTYSVISTFTHQPKTSISLPMRTNAHIDNALDSISENASAVAAMNNFFARNPDIKYVWIQWIEYTNIVRSRMMPVLEFVDSVRMQKRVGVTCGILRLLQRDYIAPGGTAAGQLLFGIDTSTLTRNVGLPPGSAPSATAQVYWLEDQPETVRGASHLVGCPRWSLQKQVQAARSMNISLLMGCEIELVFMRPIRDESGNIKSYQAFDETHSWATLTTGQLDSLPMIEEIVEALSTIDIHLPQFHAEAAPGQWEFILPPSPPLKAIDNLYLARGVISNIAHKHGLKSTVYPRPYNFTCGSACHTHFSIDKDSLHHEQSWLAGILDHLPSIIALSLPSDASYERVKGGIWSGGEWVTWGSQNKEAPLRKIEAGRYEMKTVDGMSNAYLAMAALIASGLDGIRRNKQLTHKDCQLDSSIISDAARKELGITTRLPATLEQALTALEEDELLNVEMGEEFVENYVATKREESRMLKAMTEDEARNFIIARY